jgi:hypothetical protein
MVLRRCPFVPKIMQVATLGLPPRSLGKKLNCLISNFIFCLTYIIILLHLNTYNRFTYKTLITRKFLFMTETEYFVFNGVVSNLVKFDEDQFS